ncbi:MAG: hypothetical protein Q9191_007135, partial [Dirinaria sp. TL-2023a]
MASDHYTDEEPEAQPLTQGSSTSDPSHDSSESVTSLGSPIALDRLDHDGAKVGNGNLNGIQNKDEEYDEEDALVEPSIVRPMDRRFRRRVWGLGGLCLAGWLLALVLFLSRQTYRHSSDPPYDAVATVSPGSGKSVTLDEVLQQSFQPKTHDISWIGGDQGEDGLLLERESRAGKDFLVVEDIRQRKPGVEAKDSTTLMKEGHFKVEGKQMYAEKLWPSKDFKKVLVASHVQKNWRHSFTAIYWIFDVASQTAEALDSDNSEGRIQLASWSPKSDAIVFTRDNNMFLRKLSEKKVIQITKDGGTELFYGVPDWVYEEEVFAGNSVTWWSEDGQHIAFLRTNETSVPEYPIQYFISRPSGDEPPPGEENYPEVREIKYPKAGAPNPIVDLQFYNTAKDETFTVSSGDVQLGEEKLVTEVVWAGTSGKVLVRMTNRESDILKVVLIDVQNRTEKVTRTVNVTAIDGGWFEVSEYTRFIPSDPANGRPHDGYIDTVIHENYDHLAYFSPLDNPEPLLLTSGAWEVVDAPSAIDLKNNLVYFIATKESPIQRHVYSVKLDGTDLNPLSDTSKEGYYSVSFSTGAGYALLSYRGPEIPWQKVISTPSNPDHFEHEIEDNKELAKFAAAHDLPTEIYSTVTIDGFELQVVERRPPHFDESKKYPVLFHLYGGPGSQTVDKKFTVDFQAYVASNLGYIVVTVDGRGTGFIGRKARCIIRGHIGYYEALDQIATAKIWAAKGYVDAQRIAIWGWSYGGFMTLKTLEMDAGQTFRYGMAVAPVTDWRFYDSIYTERYMHTPQHNPRGYENTTVTNVTALARNVRWLMMHGVADDNVHLQNSLTLLDRLDVAGVENYDFHAFPDSDHSIYFHNANRMVYD